MCPCDNPEERLYEKTTNYGSKTPEYVPEQEYVTSVSTYTVDYTEKPIERIPEEVLWDNKLQTEGFGASAYTDEQRFRNNFSTIYDLSYNKMRCILPDSRLAKEMKKDLMTNFGSISNYGFQDHMKYKWRLERMDNPPLITEMKDEYKKPNLKDYCTKRKVANIKVNSNMMFNDNRFKNRVFCGTHASKVQATYGYEPPEYIPSDPIWAQI